MGVKLLYGRVAAAVEVKRPPKRADVTPPIQLPADLEDLGALERHGSVLVKGAPPSMVDGAEGLPQEGLEVIDGVLPHELRGRLAFPLALVSGLGNLLLLPSAHLGLQPLQLPHAHVVLVICIHGVEERLFVAHVPAAPLDALDEGLSRTAICLWPHRGLQDAAHHVPSAMEAHAAPGPEAVPLVRLQRAEHVQGNLTQLLVIELAPQAHRVALESELSQAAPKLLEGDRAAHVPVEDPHPSGQHGRLPPGLHQEPSHHLLRVIPSPTLPRTRGHLAVGQECSCRSHGRRGDSQPISALLAWTRTHAA
mmetsp:Transcript_71657/g.184806  ORF Transcript_71657/g.184806 Transcript_71657/m.184806 type:complete len:308 (+) Transcript_71657:1252-2175(+)